MRLFFKFKDFLCFLLIISVSACGGGGGSSTPNADCSVISGNYDTICADGLVSSESLVAGASRYYQFEAIAGETYSIILTPSTGDPDVALFATSSFDGNSVIDWSVNPGLESDVIVFSPFHSGIYYLEVYAWSDSDFEIQLITGVINSKPVANSGFDQVVSKNQLVMLDGFNSYDADSDPLTYHWSQVSGIPVALSNSNSEAPTFNAPGTEGILVFELMVHDGKEYSNADSVAITVQNMAPVITNTSMSPTLVYTLDDITVHYNVYDPDGDIVDVSTSWYRNGVLIPNENGLTLSSNNFVKNDQITVTLNASDGVLSTTSSLMITIEDSPAQVEVISPLTFVNYGIASSFTVSANDPDGDPVILSLLYGPSGMSIDSVTGIVSWTPDGPMFDTQMDVNWAVRAASGNVTNDVDGVITVNDSSRLRPIVRNGIVVPGMENGMAVVDIDSDGKNEILVTNGSQLYTLEYNGTEYVQDWAYPFDIIPGGSITSIIVRDVNGDSQSDIILGGTNKLVIIDGVTLRVTRETNIDFQVVKSIEVADVDNDGQLELCFLGVEQYYPYLGAVLVLNANTLVLEWQSVSGDYGTSLAVGHLDTDNYLEIATAKGYVYGYNGTAYTNEWIYGSGFGFLVDTGDTNNDGVEEIIGAVDGIAIQAYDLSTRSILWSQSKGDIHSITVLNIDSDPEDEVLVGDGQWGNVSAYSYDSVNSLIVQDWFINSQDHSASSITVGDADGDGELEFIWGTGITSSGEDSLVIAGMNPSISVEWQNLNPSELNGPFVGGEWITVDPSDKRAIFAVASTDNGYSGSRLISMDEAGAIQISQEIGTNWNRKVSLTAADHDLDGVDEIFMSTSNLYDGYFTVLDFNRSIQEWMSPLDLGTGVATAHGDMNNDGIEDFAVLTGNGYVYVYDTLNSTVIWQSGYLGGNGIDMEIKELNGDNSPELIIATTGKITVYEKTLIGYGVRNEVLLSNVLDIVVANLDDGSGLEFIALSGYSYGSKSISVYDSQLNSISEWVAPIDVKAIFIEDSTHYRKNILLAADLNGISSYGTDGEAILAVYDPYQGAEVSRSPYLIGVPTINSLKYADINGDGIFELIFGTQTSMYMTQ